MKVLSIASLLQFVAGGGKTTTMTGGKTFSPKARKTQLSYLDMIDRMVITYLPKLKNSITQFDLVMEGIWNLVSTDTSLNLNQPCKPYSQLEGYMDTLDDICITVSSFSAEWTLKNTFSNQTAYLKMKEIVDNNTKLRDKRYKVEELLPSMKPFLLDTIYDDTYSDFNKSVIPRLFDGWEMYTDLSIQLQEKNTIYKRVQTLTNCSSISQPNRPRHNPSKANPAG